MNQGADGLSRGRPLPGRNEPNLGGDPPSVRAPRLTSGLRRGFWRQKAERSIISSAGWRHGAGLPRIVSEAAIGAESARPSGTDARRLPGTPTTWAGLE